MNVRYALRLVLRGLFALMFTYIFFTSAMVVSIFLLLLLFIWPIAKATYRKITSTLAFTVLGQMVWFCTDYANLKLHLYGDQNAYKMFGSEYHIVTSSNRGDLDWVAEFVLLAHHRSLHGIRYLPKRSIRFVPGLGLLLWALEFPYLYKNNYQTNKLMIKHFSTVYKDYPFPIQVVIYCEGTQFTVEKHRKSMVYGKNKRLPLLKHHLIPKTKMFALLVTNLRGSKFKAVYAVTVAYSNLSHNKIPTYLDMLLGETVNAYLYMSRIPMEGLPASHEELCRFGYKMYQQKDEAYEHLQQKGEFPGSHQELPPLGYTRWKLRVIMATWVFLLILLPLSIMSVFLTPTTILTVVGTLAILNLAAFSALLRYARD